MSKNTGIEYEILTKEVYEEIIKKEGFKNIEVLHNVKKEGFSKTTHQIDVYFFKYEIIKNETTIKIIDEESSVKAMKKNVSTGEKEFIKI